MGLPGTAELRARQPASDIDRSAYAQRPDALQAMAEARRRSWAGEGGSFTR